LTELADQFNDWLIGLMPAVLSCERSKATRHHERPPLAV
jgi:hypothetical protein